MTESIGSIYWEITEVCNLNCVHCYNASGTNKRFYISNDKAIEIVDGISKLNYESIALSGGEPLTHPYLDTIIDAILAKGIKVSIITNGTLIDQKFLEKIKNKAVTLQISMESCIEEENDYIRGKGNLNKLKQVFSLINDNGLMHCVSLQQTPQRINSKHVVELVEYAKKLGCRKMGFSTWQPIGRSKEHTDEFSMSTQEIIQLYNDINTEASKLATNDFFVGGFDIVNKCALLNMSENKFISPYISNQGYVYCCMGFSSPQYSIGNIYHKPIEEILLVDEKFQTMLESIICKMKSCSRCTINNICGKGCLGRVVSGDFFDDGFCQMRKYLLINTLGKRDNV